MTTTLDFNGSKIIELLSSLKFNFILFLVLKSCIGKAASIMFLLIRSLTLNSILRIWSIILWVSKSLNLLKYFSSLIEYSTLYPSLWLYFLIPNAVATVLIKFSEKFNKKKCL